MVLIEDYEISESRRSDFEHNIANNDKVAKVDLILTGRIVYITMEFEPTVNLEEAKSIALKSLEEFEEREKDYYDFMFTLKQNIVGDAGFIISGAKNAKRSSIVWNNNRVVKEAEADPNKTEKDNG